MSGIRGKNTRPEMIVRRFLHAQGFRYRLHSGSLPGKPDIVLPKYRTVVQVNGCFWHHHAKCRYVRMPKTNPDFWRTKIMSNVARDRVNMAKLESLGWRTVVVWECETRDHLKHIVKEITNESR
jgi:DNA mismatch endonuclease, patch repair protein